MDPKADPQSAELRPTGAMPVLSGLDSDDDEDGGASPRLLKDVLGDVLAAPPKRPLRPRWAKEKRRLAALEAARAAGQGRLAAGGPPPTAEPPPQNRPPAKAPVGDLFSDTPTKVVPVPKAAPVELPRLDASIAKQVAGERELTIVHEKSEHPEPTITVAEDFLEDMGIIPAEKFPTAMTRPRIDPQELVPNPQDATRVISMSAVEHVGRHSGPVPAVVGPTARPGASAAHPAVSRPATAAAPAVAAPVSAAYASLGQSLGQEGQQEQTRIVSSLNLQELHDPRARRTRSQGVVAVTDSKTSSKPGARMSGANAKVEAPGKGNSKPGVKESGKQEGKQKKNLIALIKAKSKLKQAPVDPSRVLTQQEMVERLAKESSLEKSGLNRFFEKSGTNVGASLGDDGSGGDQVEGTLIGRFLGMVGIAPAQPGQASQAPGLPGVSQPKGRDPNKETWDLVLESSFLDGINPQFLRDAVSAGDLRIVTLARDMLLDTEGRALLVHEGQVALARFDAHTLDKERRAQRAYKAGDKKAEKREQNRRQEVGPIIRLCESNLAVFLEGDLVGIDPAAEKDPRLACYSVTPVKLLSISKARMESWRRTYQFFGERIHNAAEAAKSRMDAASGARSLVADFYVRHGMSIAMTLRVRELDKCIECYECEKACEDRYGVKRLSLKGKILGALDFVDCCRTCNDQRCVDVCGYDAIKYSDAKKEVLISEDACTGCSMCSIACPYDAIEMHELDDRPLLRIRLEKENKLGFGDGKGRKAQLRRIASKCDHCQAYEDQACISACPTSALLEVEPDSIFTERTDDMAEAARGGFSSPALADPVQVFNPQRFFKGLEGQAHKGRQVERKFSIGWLWAVGILCFLACCAEIALRKLMPAWSLLYYYQTRVEGLDAEVALLNIDFRPGSEFAVWLGWIGTVLMFSSTFYSAHKWIPGIKKLGSYQAWFDWHVWSGTVGPMFVLLHTAAKLDNWVSLAIWSMVMTVVSGLIGRYLSTNLPDVASQAALRVLDLERQLAELRNRHAGVSTADRFHEGMRRRFARVSGPDMSGLGAGFLAFRMLLQDDLARPFRRLSLQRRLVNIKDRKARRQVARVTTRLVHLDRQRLLLPRIEPLFHEWKTVHIPFAIVLTILSGIHIFVELVR